MTALIATLLAQGLPALANSVLDLLTNSGEAAVKEFIKDKTGLDLTGDETSLTKDQLTALRTAEDELAFETEENRHEEVIFQKELEDVKNARDMGREFATNDDKFLARFVPYISMMIIASGFTYITAITFLDVPEENRQVVTSTIEFVKVIVTMTVSYWLGTSFSSSKKDKQIEYDARTRTDNLNLF